MDFDWSFLLKNVTAIIPAASGLIGVYMGSTLASRREEAREKAQSKRETNYLAILVVSHLDRLVNRCVDVVGDDGTSYGQPAGKGGNYQATVAAPTFDPLSLGVEWKILPSDLMYRILSLPYAMEMLNQRISNTGEFDMPPDYSEFFWARQHGYAELGLQVAGLAYELRLYAGLPVPQHKAGDWNRDDYLQDRKEVLEEGRRLSEASARVPPFRTNVAAAEG